MPKAEDSDLKSEETFKTGAPATQAGVSEDPFATDFFIQRSDLVLTDDIVHVEALGSVNFALPEKIENRIFWQTALPRVSTREAQISRDIARLPHEFSEQILRLAEQAISSCVLNEAATAECEIVAVEESDLTTETNLLADEQAVFLTFAAEPNRALAAIAIDAIFAAQIVESAISAEKNAVFERRPLSPTELNVLEFFAVYFFNSLNRYLGEPLCRQIIAEQKVPAWFKQLKLRLETDDSNFDLGLPQSSMEHQPLRGLAAKIKLQLHEFQGIINLLLPFRFLESLSGKQNPLLLRHDVEKKRGRLKKIIDGGALLRVLLGETTLTADDLAILERSDVILIEKVAINRENAILNGTTLVKIAAETLGSLRGELMTDEATGALRFRVREIRQRGEIGGEPARLKMDERLPGEPDEEASALALEKITVTLAVELVSRRVTLDELASLRSGQIIDLGCRATDPVELVADGKTVAIGELVDVEGSLGVRVLRILI